MFEGDRHNAAEDEDKVDIELSNGRNPEAGDIEDISLDAVFSGDDSDVTRDDSESDNLPLSLMRILLFPLFILSV
uniref:Uncharacterized protein n=1 Tax=Quercus lobata TaxID=97700 RepID=A0A7N2MEK2_QUELO